MRVILAAMALILACAGGARPDWVNPCSFGGFDQPCRIDGGSYRALKPTGDGPFPAVVYLHGSGGHSTDIASNAYFQKTVVDRGYVLIVPTALDAVQYVSGRSTGWSLRARREHPRDDVAFLRRVLAHAEDRFSVDKRRILFVGQSDGGFLIWEIACHEPSLASAYAVHAGSYGGPLPAKCKAPMRFLQVHGRADQVVPFEAERTAPNGLWIDAANELDGLSLLARTNGCRSGPTDLVTVMDVFEHSGWSDCARDSALDFYVHEGGHGFPWQFMPAVIDWFEALPLTPVGVGTTAFHKAQGKRSTLGGRFKSVPGAAFGN